MKNKIIIWFVCLGVLFVNIQAAAQTKRDVIGLRVGMSKDAALERLQKLGTKDHDERRNQEIWVLKDNPYFSHAIVAFDRDYKNVRFVTAKARENGKRMRYSDVLDVKKAALQTIGNNYKYTLEMPASGKNPGYKIIARGTDKNYLTYFSVEELDPVAP